MLRNQDITIPYGNTRRVSWNIEDVTNNTTEGPTNLIGKGIRWELYKSSRDDTPIITLTDADPSVTIDTPDQGVVSVKLTAEQTKLDIHSGRYYLYVTEGSDEWTVATGKYTLTR